MPSALKPAALIVDDEPFIRMAAADAFEDLGFSPYEAGDADEALDILSTHPEIELLFTDINMPGSMDGVALARCACSRRPGLGILVTSGRERPKDLPGGGTFIPKPYRPHQLAEAIERKSGRA